MSGSDVKESACNAGEPGFHSWVRKIPWRRIWQTTPVFLPEESQGNWQATVFMVSQSDMTDVTQHACLKY